MAAQETKVEKRNVVKIIETWNGSVRDEKLIQPECIMSQKGRDAVWETWKVAGDALKIDFTKHLIIAVYSSGNVVNIRDTTLDEKGNLDFGRTGSKRPMMAN